MTDQLSLATVAGTTLPQVFGFLFGRLEAVLDRRAQSRAEEEFRTALADPPATFTLQTEALTEVRLARLASASRELAAYRRNPDLIRLDNEALVRTLSEVRDDLETIYDQRFTFAGERRPTAGVRVVQHVDKVKQDALVRALRARRVTEKASVDVQQTARTVLHGGELTALDIEGTLG
ncbi:hypothetical protein E5083_16215 [Streptomyces bauhiniae]|uniref:Uncharacterized protein n=1 Tax=Streptomyces bauhiniae TaxID=2340725 RepID=A0A4Z1D4K0_9ACTN|nr:hypothetical protein [Streptomyces bauhiniae]TGN76722.1 hypothetical protein E5083_16215 [Streptomyces bauhiniae]